MDDEASGTRWNHPVATFQQYININSSRPLSIKVIIYDINMI